jgi:hypothetical protein
MILAVSKTGKWMDLSVIECNEVFREMKTEMRFIRRYVPEITVLEFIQLYKLNLFAILNQILWEDKMSYIYSPKVNEIQEFIEIANDFANPLDIVREAISNSYDAHATEISMSFDVIKQAGETIFKITISDNGNGMTEDDLKSFFDLGNSTRKQDIEAIGEKGHGTKVYFNSKKIKVTTCNRRNKILAEVNNPFNELFDGRIPPVNISVLEETEEHYTVIEIYEYNKNRRDKFTHELVKDHILWFTRHGGIDVIPEHKPESKYKDVIIKLKGLDREDYENLKFGHIFPQESISLNKFLDDYITKAPDYYCKRVYKKINLKQHPEIAIEIIFSIEGKTIKYNYNKMIRHSGYIAPEGSYTMAERYGLWLCKDFIPIQRKNEWVTTKGQEHTRFQAFVNCQEFRLTANRGSIENTPTELVLDIENTVRDVHNNIICSDDWNNIDWLEEEAIAVQTSEKEKKNYDWRISKIKKANIAEYKGYNLIQPEKEQGVYSLFLILKTIEPTLFPFYILDYDTHEGIDVIVKSDKTTSIHSSKLYYVEFKNRLDKNFNHCFENIHSIICWDTDIKNDEEVSDLQHEGRKMAITKKDAQTPYTTYMLINPKKAHNIEVYVLKDYLKEKLGIEFRPRTSQDTV